MTQTTTAEVELGNLFKKHFGSAPTETTLLPQSGSNRKYYRLTSGERTAIGVISSDRRENEAFLSFSESLKNGGVNVPEIYASDLDNGIYLQQDLGDETLFARLSRTTWNGDGRSELVDIYKKVLRSLASIQQVGRSVIDFGKCHPRGAFDRQSMTWDLQYFKYYFLKLAHIEFNEQDLEDDFSRLMDFLLTADTDFFLYRDFQSRNIMLIDDEPWFIDYQGGRRGAREYDVASLLYDAKAAIPDSVRAELLESYIGCLPEPSRQSFREHYFGYVLIRIMQAMGAYGYRGFFEKKAHFLRSIPLAMQNIGKIVEEHLPSVEMPELTRVLREIATSDELLRVSQTARLTLTVTSFSYRHGIPTDNSGNGGGFVFDCRALPNPGRYEQYKQMTGRDRAVIDFFAEHKGEMDHFLSLAKQMVQMSIETYMRRGFTSLVVNFGCTGGQHRSVFCADSLAKWAKANFDCDVRVIHWEQKQLK